MKQVLFVINTLGCAGAETAMIEMIRNMDPEKYKISVFVLLNQGEMIHRLPKSVTVLNEHFSDSSVLSKEGKNYTVIFSPSCFTGERFGKKYHIYSAGWCR